jgi:hypothetical protein
MVVLLKWKGKCSCRRAKLAHVVGHLPVCSLGMGVDEERMALVLQALRNTKQPLMSRRKR